MLRTLSTAAVLLFTSLACLSAQLTNAGSCLNGRTMDTSDAPLSEVQVTARGSDPNLSYSAASDSAGKVHFCDLPPDQYRIVAHRTGLSDSVRYESLTGGGNLSVTFVLGQANGAISRAKPVGATVQSTEDMHEPLDLNGWRGLSNVTQADAMPQEGSGSPGVGPIREFSVVSNFISPERLPDTPSASNGRAHGQVYGLLGSDLAQPSDVTLRDQLPLSKFGGLLGGSFGPGRTAYFMSFDRLLIDQQRLLSHFGTSQAYQGVVSLPRDSKLLTSRALMARIDHQFGQHDSAFARFNREETHRSSLLGGQNANPSSGFNVVRQTAAAGNTVTLSPNMVDEAQAEFTSTNVQLPAGAAVLGLRSGMPALWRNRVFHASNNIYRQLGSQSLRMGGDFIYNQMNLSFLEASLGRAAAGDFSLRQSDRAAGFYILGQHTVGPNFVLTTGIRYDLESIRGFRPDTNNVAPQLGFAWSPGDSSRTVIRGGVSIYYDQIPLPALAGSLDPASGAANLMSSAVIANRSGTPVAGWGSFTVVSPAIQNAYAEHANLQAEQQIGARSSLSADYEYVRGVQLALPVRRSVLLCASANVCNAGNEFAGQQIGTGAVSSYSAVSIAFTQQPIRWGNYKVSYTYSAAEGSGTGENASYINDQMQRVSFTGILHTSLDPGSNLWQRLSHGFLLTGTSDYTSRSEFAGLSFINLNARLSKTLILSRGFRLEGLIETFNTFQRANEASFATATNEMGEEAADVLSTYRRVATAQSPNGSQVGLRLSF